METLKGVVEAVEGEFGEAIVARDEAIANLVNTPGLGPPDLCWLQKNTKGAFGRSTQDAKGYYHYTLGRDVSNSAAVAAYFVLLNSQIEPMTFLQGFWYSSEYVIEKGFYCVYDPFTRLDVRLELKVPGGVLSGAIDAKGGIHEVTPELWRNIHIASFLRAELYEPEFVSAFNNLVRFDPISKADMEQRLLDSIEEMYRSKKMELEGLTLDPGLGVTAEHMDILLHTVLHYFGRRQRWHSAANFFQRLAAFHAPALVYVAAASREINGFEESFSMLARGVDANPLCPSLLVALANECLYADQVDLAARLSRRAIRIDNNLRPAWLVLSRCYVRHEQLDLALVTLNVIPPPPAPLPEDEALFTTVPPTPKYLTSPAVKPYDPNVEHAKQVTLETFELDGREQLKQLPGTFMIHRDPPDLGAWPDLGPGRITRTVLASVYGVMQEMVSSLGWDEFLELRALSFVMHEELGSLGGASAISAVDGGYELDTDDSEADLDPEYEGTLEEIAAMGLEGNIELPARHRLPIAALKEAESRKASFAGWLPNTGHSVSSDVPRISQPPFRPASRDSVSFRSNLNPAAGSAASSAAAGASSRMSQEGRQSSLGPARAPPSTSSQPETPAASNSTHLQPSFRASASGQRSSLEGSSKTAMHQQAPEQQASVNGARAMPTSSTQPGKPVPLNNSSSSGSKTAVGVSPASTVEITPAEERSGIASSSAARAAAATPAQMAQQAVSTHSSASGSSKASASQPPAYSATDHKSASSLIGTSSRSMTAQPMLQASSQRLSASGARASPLAASGPVAPAFEKDIDDFVVDLKELLASEGPSIQPRSGLGWNPRSAAPVAPLWAKIFGAPDPAHRQKGPIGESTLPGLSLRTSQHSCSTEMVEGTSLCVSNQEDYGSGLWEGWEGEEPGPSQTNKNPDRAALKRLLPKLIHRLAASLSQQQSRSLKKNSTRPIKASSRNGKGAKKLSMKLSGRRQSWSADVDGRVGLGWTLSYLHRNSVPALQEADATTNRPAVILPAGPVCEARSSSGAGASGIVSAQPHVLSMEADREAAILGRATAQPGAKRLCSRWLDELIVALWHDLQAYMEWKMPDQDLMQKAGHSHASLLLGLPRGEGGVELGSPTARSELAKLPALTPGDWMRRGLLAERLYHDEDALLAYRCCVRSTFNLTSWLAILRLAAQADDIHLALSAAQAVVSWHSRRQLGTDSASGNNANLRFGWNGRRPPLALLAGLNLLAAHAGGVSALISVVKGQMALAPITKDGGEGRESLILLLEQESEWSD